MWHGWYVAQGRVRDVEAFGILLPKKKMVLCSPFEMSVMDA